MNNSSRRDWLKQVAAGAVALSTGNLLFLKNAYTKTVGNIVVVGAGFGGATCARYIKTYAPDTNVTLVDPNNEYVSCPFSNLVIAGIKPIKYVTHDYSKLTKKYSINIVHEWVSKIHKTEKKLTLKSGKTLAFDYLVVSPGVDFIWEKIAGYDEAASQVVPHAWKAGEQTLLLHNQIKSMKDGGTFIISAPEGPFRAPPAPYERASLVAYYFKKNKPKSKVIILDPNGKSEKLELFKQAWKKHYKGMVEWVGDKDAHITKVDVKNKALFSQSGIQYKGDVINLIPPQHAANIVRTTGLTNESGWCDVDPASFESKQLKSVYVIGDAIDAGDMPKLAHSANSQAKICAAAILSRLDGKPSLTPLFNSSIYSFISPKLAISEVGVYRIEQGRIKRVSGGTSSKNASKKTRRKESKFAYGWYKGITRDMLG